MLFIFQLLFSLFALFAVASVYAKKHSGLLGVGSAIFWIFFWLIAIIFVWWPNALTVVANSLGIGRGTDLVLYVALAVVFYLLFRLSVRLEFINRDLTKVIRDRSLSETQEKDSSTRSARSE